MFIGEIDYISHGERGEYIYKFFWACLTIILHTQPPRLLVFFF